ncbi:MAG TPA: hypothetical protein VFA30_05480 [Gaiellaceae bacterium]|nr:hypothetical protein [Gaiellaceae bacterium]
MSKVSLLVGTRKGLFILDSDDRHSWRTRGPFCESWPVYHAIQDPSDGTIYVGAGSEWHGAAVWRSKDLGETWEWSGEGIKYPEGDEPITKVASVTAAHGKLYAGVGAPGIFESADGGVTWSLLSRLEDQAAFERFKNPENSPPGRLGLIATVFDPDDPKRFFANVQGFGIWETEDGGSSWTPRNQGLRADWPLEDPAWGYCVHKLVRSPADPDRIFEMTHVGAYVSHDRGASFTEITEGLPSDFGFAAAAHPHDRDTAYMIPLDPQHGRYMHDGHAAVWMTRDAGSSWQRLDNGLPQDGAYLGVLREGMATDTQDVPGVYFGTSTGQIFASADEGASWSEIANYLPAITSIGVAEAA